MSSEESQTLIKNTHIFDASEYLDSEKKIVAYLHTIIEDEDWDILLPSIAIVAKARAVNRIVERHNLDRDSLYKRVRPESVSIGAILRPMIEEGAKASPQRKLPWITSIKSRDDYTIAITFEDGLSGQLDIKKYLASEIFKPLNDLVYFHQVHNYGRYLCWPDDQDLCADSIAYTIRTQRVLGEEYVNDQEMEEIRSNTELLRSLAKGVEDARAGRGRFLEPASGNDGTFASTPKFDLFQECLHEMMRSVSQEVYFAGWLQDLEYLLWQVIEGKLQRDNYFDIDEDRADKLRQLSRLCGGWIICSKHLGTQWVPIEQWTILYQEWLKSKTPESIRDNK
jgi:probable addiction module antidote protein